MTLRELLVVVRLAQKIRLKQSMNDHGLDCLRYEIRGEMFIMLDYIAMFICGAMFMFCLLMLRVILPMFKDDEDDLDEMNEDFKRTNGNKIKIEIVDKRNADDHYKYYKNVLDALYEDVKGDNE